MRLRPNCPACNGHGDTVFACDFAAIDRLLAAKFRRRVNVAGQYRISRCEVCGTHWQDAPDDALLVELYGEWLTKAEYERVDNPLATRDGHEVMALQSYFGRKDIRVLDFGMGRAAWARTAKALGCETYGSDLSETVMAFAAKHGIAADHGELDYINAEQVFEHLADPAEQLSRLTSSLVKGGIVKISVPAPYGLKRGIEKLRSGRAEWRDVMQICPLEHLQCYSREGLRRLGGRFGFQSFRPAVRHRYAFLRAGKVGGLKEVVRPELQWINPRNIYIWLRKA